nr:hypothetical protein [Tanacetum cinerariifolium]
KFLLHRHLVEGEAHQIRATGKMTTIEDTMVMIRRHNADLSCLGKSSVG